jgi:hypothetical protein
MSDDALQRAGHPATRPADPWQIDIAPDGAGTDNAITSGATEGAARGRKNAVGYFARAAYRVLTTPKDGPSLYDLCDQLLLRTDAGNGHLRKFYKTALANLPLRTVLARAGHPQLRDAARYAALRDAIITARDHEAPDWDAIGRPLAALLDEADHPHPKPKRISEPSRDVSLKQVDDIIRACANHLVSSYARNGFIPCYAAFNLIGDPDFHGRDLMAALCGLNARTYKNSTFLFNVARVFIAQSPAAALVNPPWTGIAEPMWEPVQIRHRSAYYDAFYAEALMDYLASGIATPQESAAARDTIARLIDFCLGVSRERVGSVDGQKSFDVITALAPPPHSRLSSYFERIKTDLGFGTYVPDCDTTACAFSAASQFGSRDNILDQPMIDFYADHQVGSGFDRAGVTVPLNDNIDYQGGVVTWIANLSGDRPFGNDLDPTLNLDVLEAAFRNFDRWQIAGSPRRIETLRAIVSFHRRLAESGAFAEPRSHIYYLPELYSAYFARCYSALRALPPAAQRLVDPDDSFEFVRRQVLAYVVDELIAAEMNPFDAALALLALAKLQAGPQTFTAPLDCLVRHFGEGRRGAPYKAYEWNKMKTPTRILVGGPEATSAFVLSALAHARKFLNA